VAYVDRGAARLVSRKQNIDKSFATLTTVIAAALPCADTISANRFLPILLRNVAEFFPIDTGAG
jgi:hypothetical protein